jgi:hypothetical protein
MQKNNSKTGKTWLIFAETLVKTAGEKIISPRQRPFNNKNGHSF